MPAVTGEFMTIILVFYKEQREDYIACATRNQHGQEYKN